MKTLLIGVFLLTGAGVTAGIASCGSFGEDAPAEDPDASADASSGDGGATSGGEAGTVGEVGKAPCDPSEKAPAYGTAVYVSEKTGADEAGSPSGEPDKPYKSIGAALGPARALGATIIVVEKGTYPEQVVLKDFPKGVTVDGSWEREGTVWSRDCSDNRVGKTLLQSPTDVGIVFEGLAVRSVLSNLTVTTRGSLATLAGKSGASRTGVLAKSSTVALENVKVVASPADRGGAATPGVGGVSNCAPATTTTTCAVGGAAGANAPAAPPAPAAGSFSDTGYTPVNGKDGAPGGPGGNGKAGGLGTTRNDCETGCNAAEMCQSKQGSVTPPPGRCGCGGLGGGGGQAGFGGGASVAILAIGSTVSVKYSELVAGDGGDASSGGAGGAGGPSNLGAAGVVTTKCWTTSCCTNGQPCPGAMCGCFGKGNWAAICSQQPVPPERPLVVGTAGGAGFAGGKGASGSAGAGGPSFTYVPIGNAQVLIAESKRTFGRAGTGSVSGSSGEKP